MECLVPLEVGQGIHLNKRGSQGNVRFCWRVAKQVYETGGNFLGEGCNTVMELGQGGRYSFNHKVGVSLYELDLRRIRPKGGQFDGDSC